MVQILLTQDGILRSTAAVQMRWAEKNFATLEMFYDMCCYTNDECRVYAFEGFWPCDLSVFDEKDLNTVLHSPLPQLLYRDTHIGDGEYRLGILRILLHFCDFLFPLFGATGSGLDKVTSRIPAVFRVNDFIKTRYCMVYTYVHIIMHINYVSVYLYLCTCILAYIHMYVLQFKM